MNFSRIHVEERKHRYYQCPDHIDKFGRTFVEILSKICIRPKNVTVNDGDRRWHFF